MVGILIRTINLLVCGILLCSCCKIQYEKGSLSPEWSAKIPTFESQEIFYDGLPNLPKEDKIIVAHTSVFDGGFMREDNRLCGMDLNTGEVKWYFPADLSTRYFFAYEANGYLHNGKILFQYQKDCRTFDAQYDYSTACLDINTGEIIWEKTGRIGKETVRRNRDIVGNGSICYFVQDSSKVFQVDIINNQVDELCDVYPFQIDRIKYCEGVIVLSCRHSAMVSAIIINPTTKEIHTFSINSNSGCPPYCFLENGILYANDDRYITAIDTKINKNLWERNDMFAYGVEDIIIYNNTLMKCACNALIGYDKKNGDIIYYYDNYGSVHTSKDGRYAYLLNSRNIVDIINIETGEKLDYIVCPNRSVGFFGSYPMIYDDKLYIIGDNTLYRYPTYPWNE